MSVTVTFAPSLSRTQLILPTKKREESSSDEIALPVFKGKRSTGGEQTLSFYVLRRSIKTKNRLRQELQSILSQSGQSDVSSQASPSIPQVTEYSSPILVSQNLSRNHSNDTLISSSFNQTAGASSSELLQLTSSQSNPSPSATRVGDSAVSTILRALVTRCRPSTPANAVGVGVGGSLSAVVPSRPQSAADSLVDIRPPSRNAISLYKEKLCEQLETSLPESLLDIDGLQATTTTMYPSGHHAVALPENILIPCASRNPEALYPPRGVRRVIRDVRSVKPLPPTAHVRMLQQQLQVEIPQRSHEDSQSRIHLRPKSVDVVEGRRPRPPDDAVLITQNPTTCTTHSRQHVAKAREFLNTQLGSGSAMEDSKSLSRIHSFGNVAGARDPTRTKILRFRDGIITHEYNS